MDARRLDQTLRISLRNARRFQLQTVMMLLAALTGTGGVIVSTGFAAGGRDKILNQFNRLGANLLIVTPIQSRAVGGHARTGSIVTTLNDSDYKAILESVTGISRSSPTVSTVLRIRAGDLTKNTTIVGCEPDLFRMKNWQLASGALADASADGRSNRIVWLGATASSDLFADEDPIGREIVINRVPFVVAGVLAERGQGLDAANEDDRVYVPLETAMHRLMNIQYFTSILFELNGTDMDIGEQQIGAILDKRHRSAGPGARDFEVQNQKRLIEAQLAAFGRLTFLIDWIAASTLAVSSLGIFAVTWMAVRNRTREIGTRRAVGATPGDILIQFMAEGLSGTVSGACTGIVIGFFALQWIDTRLRQPFEFSKTAVALEFLASITLYSSFIWISSFKANRIPPTVALRAE